MIVCSFEELVLFSMILKIRTTRRLQVEISSKLSIFKCKKYPWSRFLGKRKKKRKIEEKHIDILLLCHEYMIYQVEYTVSDYIYIVYISTEVGTRVMIRVTESPHKCRIGKN